MGMCISTSAIPDCVISAVGRAAPHGTLLGIEESVLAGSASESFTERRTQIRPRLAHRDPFARRGIVRAIP